MTFFLVNDELYKQIEEIKQKITLSMNGVASDNMKKYGIIYKKNYGVSIPRIREIGAMYPPNYDLAQRLWNIEIRECMILATLLQVPDKFDKNDAENWIKKVDNIELAEQLTMNLLSKTDMAMDLAFDWVESTILWKQIAGLLLSVRIYRQFSFEQAKKITGIILPQCETEEFHIYKNIALFLSRLCRNGSKTVDYIESKINSFASSDNAGKKYILNEVKEEILFLKN